MPLMNAASGISYQYLHGRIPHQGKLGEKVDGKDGVHRFTQLARRSMDSMGLDIQVVFPTPMLERFPFRLTIP